MGRILKRRGNCNWITIGAKEGKDGKRGGSPVCVDGHGRIVSGHPNLTGRTLGNMQAEGHFGSHRQQLEDSKRYSRAKWRKEAKKQGFNPNEVEKLADEMLSEDKDQSERKRDMLQHARRKQNQRGKDSLQGLQARASRGDLDYNSIVGFDETAESIANSYPEFFHSDDPEQELFDMLVDGNPKRMTADEAFEMAMDRMHDISPRATQEQREALDDFFRSMRRGVTKRMTTLKASRLSLIRVKDFDESKHPRGEDGRFGSGGSSASKPKTESGKTTAIQSQTHATADKAAKGIVSRVGGQVDALANKVPIVGHLKRGMTKVMTKFKGALAKRYGDKMATVILGSGAVLDVGAHGVAAAVGLPLYIPGATIIGSIPALVMAESYLQARKIMGKSDSEIDADEATRIAGKLRDALVAELGKMIESNRTELESTGKQSKSMRRKSENADEADPEKVLDVLADILGGIFGDAALDMIAELEADDAKKEKSRKGFYGCIRFVKGWTESDHPRGKNGRFISRNSPEAVTAAKEAIADALSGKSATPATVQGLIDNMSILTVKQLHELRKKYELRASGKLKRDLVKKLGERLYSGRRFADESKPEKPKTSHPLAGKSREQAADYWANFEGGKPQYQWGKEMDRWQSEALKRGNPSADDLRAIESAVAKHGGGMSYAPFTAIMKESGVTDVNDFQAALLKLNRAGKIELHPFTGANYQMTSDREIDPRLIIPASQELKTYASPGKNKKPLDSVSRRDTIGSSDKPQPNARGNEMNADEKRALKLFGVSGLSDFESRSAMATRGTFLQNAYRQAIKHDSRQGMSGWPAREPREKFIELVRDALAKDEQWWKDVKKGTIFVSVSDVVGNLSAQKESGVDISNMQKLEGSEKQIAWAEKIRSAAMAKVSDPDKMNEMAAETSAKWWIDNRNKV